MEEPVDVQCPWCGEVFTTFFDISSGSTSYIEDCQVCCRPIVLSFRLTRLGNIKVQTDRS
jgi:hypothetical protein